MTLLTHSSSVWHPFTQPMLDYTPLKVRSGRGAIIELEDGRQLIDCVSSWFVNIHGHSHPRIAAAIFQQALSLDHVMFAGFTHEPAEKFARMLVDVLPEGLEKVFYCDNGSTAVEAALKQAYQYWYNKGERQRTAFLTFEGAYFGDTVGAMSLSSRSLFTKPFEKIMFDVHTVPCPTIDDALPDLDMRESQVLQQIEEVFIKNRNRYAAVIIEPLVQGVGGMRFHRTTFLQQLEKLVRQYDTLLIYDEVMTGFGRTGELFACTKTDTCPDIICLAKGIAGGCLPFGATVCTQEVYDAFCSEDISKTFLHGHSFSAHPMGCVASIVSLELLLEKPELYRGMEARHRPHLERLKRTGYVRNVRCCGTIAAMDVVASGQESYGSNFSFMLRRKCLEKGLIVRPFGNILYLFPPYCITDDQLAQAYDGITEVLQSLV